MNSKPFWQIFMMIFFVLFGLSLLFGLSFPFEPQLEGILLLGTVVAWAFNK